MQSIELNYGTRSLPFEYDDERFEIVRSKDTGDPLNDNELGRSFDNPIDCEPLEEIVRPGESVLVAVPDATRDVGAGQVLNLLIRRLIANGTMPYEISVIFSTGLHRPVSEGEKQQIMTPFIAQRVKTIDHDANNLAGLVRIGETSDGLPIELNRSVPDSDQVILIGGVTFHYFAGFTGGRKLVCPGLASKRTILGTHSLAFDSVSGKRAEDVGPGILAGNPVHEAFLQAVSHAAPSFSFSTHTDQSGRITRLYGGDWQVSHRKACEEYARDNMAKLESKRDLVIVSCGGFPHDINLIQSQKAIEMAGLACREGGTIIVLAECKDGAGSKEFEKWIGYGSSGKIAGRLCERYSVGGQTAWSLLRKAEKFDIRIITTLPIDLTQKAGLRKEAGLVEALQGVSPSKNGYILPFGAKTLPAIQ